MTSPRRGTASALLIVGLLAVNVPAAEPRDDVKTIVRNDRWSLAEGKGTKKPLIIRFRSGIDRDLDVSAYPRRIAITWTYRGDANGMPSRGEINRMRIFEERLSKAVETDLSAALMAVTTHDGSRLWLYYTADTEQFGRRLNAMPQEKDRYPITLESADDPTWAYFHDRIVANVEGVKK